MSQINPLTGALIHAPIIQQAAAEKDRQLRRIQNLSKNTTLQGDRLEHQVESADAPHAVIDDRDSYQPGRQPPRQEHSPSDTVPPEEGQDPLDLCA